MAKEAIHPIARVALACFPAGVAGRPRVDPDQRRELERALSELLPKPELKDAVVTLIRLAQVLDAQKASFAAGLILEVARTAIPALQRICGHTARDLAAAAQTNFRRFAGEPKAPVFRRAKPEVGLGLLALRSGGGAPR